MNAERFFAFTATRPDEEKWKRIGGEPILNASATRLHRKIALNLIAPLDAIAQNAAWDALPGLGVRLSEISGPFPTS